MAELDLRIVKVSFEINGQIKTYQNPLDIKVFGTKYGNALQNECVVSLSNLEESTQNYILTETSPYNLNRTPKVITVEAGRESYGTSVIYRGNIVSASLSQPPDMGVALSCLTGNFVKGNVIASSQPGQATLEQITSQIAQDTNTILNFQATNKNISNYQFSGGALDQVAVASSLGNFNVFIDDDVLVVKDASIPLSNSTKILSPETDMIGIPEFTERGIKVKYLLDTKTKLGGALEIRSRRYSAANGIYNIYKLAFQVTNRDTPFYYIAEAARIP